MKHRCHVGKCEVQIPPSKLMCFDHWSMVPPELKRAVNLAYAPGQEEGKIRPSEKWLKAARAAILAVEKREQDVPKDHEHKWRKTSNLIYCSKCRVIKGSDPDKESVCPGESPEETP